MPNPVTSWPFRVIDPDKDGPKLDQNFQALIDWAMTGAVHTHHIQRLQFTITNAGSAFVAYTGLTWPLPFPAGVTPDVLLTPNSTNAAKPAASELLTYVAYNISNTGCSVGVLNNSGTAVGAGAYMVVTAIDPNYSIET